jgi:hypothetical protein
MGFWATGDDNPASDGQDPWANMKETRPPIDFKGAGDMYSAAFNNAKVWQPSAKAATVAPVGITRTDAASRGYQANNAALLADIAAGKTLGAGASAYNRNLATGMSANNAMAVSRTHGNALAGSMRTLGNTNQGMAVSGQSKLNAIKAQEQIAADQALAGQLAGLRAQDMGIASEAAKMQAAQNIANAGFANQTSIENQMAGLYADAWRQKALGAKTGHDMQMWENDMARERHQLGLDITGDDLAWRRQQDEARRTGQAFDTFGTWVGYGVADNSRTGGKT